MSTVRGFETRLSSNHHHGSETTLREATSLTELEPKSDPSSRSHTQTIQEEDVFHDHDRSSLDPSLHLQ
jgi:hypothetical protein